MKIHATTILTVQHGDVVAMGGDGQVTLGTAIMKADAMKIRKLLDGKVLCGFAGSSADSFALLERFEQHLKSSPTNIVRASTELAKQWRMDKALRQLEALLTVSDGKHTLLVSGTGDVIQPTDGVVGIGSGGNYAIAAARALKQHSQLSATEIVREALTIAGGIDIYTNQNIVVEELNVSKLIDETSEELTAASRELIDSVLDVKSNPDFMKTLTPKEIVEQLDRYIVGQAEAKRSVAIAIRNRWRRQQLPDEMRQEVSPKNILMIGSTGVGKTEIARRLANLTGAPFIKVEATKYTEVGYYGRDVESMVRELVDNAISLVRNQERENVKETAEKRTNKRLLDLLCPAPVPYEFSASPPGEDVAETPRSEGESFERTRSKMKKMLLDGELDERTVEITVEQKSTPVMMGGIGVEQMDMDFQGMLEKIMPTSRVSRELKVADARKVLFEQECDALLDSDKINGRAIELAENSGIIFLDEIDKVIASESKSADVSRQGVQRDLLPIVEGTTIQTKHGYVKTNHILFIAAGAFHRHQPSELMPELQGRFPIRVELNDLTKDDFVRILTEPKNSLTRQYMALLDTEGVSLEFTDDAIEELASVADHVNQSTMNIGARRLYTILEHLLEELSFEAPNMTMGNVSINAAYVKEKLGPAAEDEDLSKYIL